LNVFTKIFVVLVTIMAVILVALIVPFVANTQNFREEIEKVRTELALAEARAQTKQNELSALQLNQSIQALAAANQKQDLEQQVSQLGEELRQAEGARQDAAARNAELSARISSLTVTSQNQSALLEKQEEELSARRKSTIELERKLIEQGDRISEVLSENERLTRRLRRTQEENAALAQRNEELERLIQQAGVTEEQAETAQPFTPGFRVQGEVVRVEEAAGETFVEINVGKTDEVAKNMKFLVSRDGRYLGTLVVTMVDDRNSVGVLTLRAPDGANITSGDRVQTGE